MAGHKSQQCVPCPWYKCVYVGAIVRAVCGTSVNYVHSAVSRVAAIAVLPPTFGKQSPDTVLWPCRLRPPCPPQTPVRPRSGSMGATPIDLPARRIPGCLQSPRDHLVANPGPHSSRAAREPNVLGYASEAPAHPKAIGPRQHQFRGSAGPWSPLQHPLSRCAQSRSCTYITSDSGAVPSLYPCSRVPRTAPGCSALEPPPPPSPQRMQMRRHGQVDRGRVFVYLTGLPESTTEQVIASNLRDSLQVHPHHQTGRATKTSHTGFSGFVVPPCCESAGCGSLVCVATRTLPSRPFPPQYPTR